MTTNDALTILQNECTGLPSGQQKTDFQLAIDVLSGASTAITEAEAMDILNDTYWDVTLGDQCTFAAAAMFIACTTDPNRPMPEVRV